jgi:hypothetical protein
MKRILLVFAQHQPPAPLPAGVRAHRDLEYGAAQIGAFRRILLAANIAAPV